jgi:hypothetical protein
MWEPHPLITLWVFTACYRDSFTYMTCDDILSELQNQETYEGNLVLASCLFHTVLVRQAALTSQNGGLAV